MKLYNDDNFSRETIRQETMSYRNISHIGISQHSIPIPSELVT